MKRNSLLMLAYIIFIFICAIVRLFGEFPRWQVLVAAITATSWIFSLADFNYAVTSELHAISKDILEYEESCIENIQGMIDIIDAFLTREKGEPHEAERGKTEHYTRTKQEAEKCLTAFREMKTQAKRNNCFADVAGKWAAVLTIVGFVMFFSILSFEKIAQIFTKSQDIMTVMAFGLILFTQYMGEVSKGQREKQKEAADAVRNGWDSLHKSFELEVSHHAD